MDSPDDIPLFSLPPELRNSIYDRVFHGDISNADSLALMRASQELHVQAGSHFYANNNFVLKLPGPVVPGATVLPPINDRYLPFLKDIGIEIDVGCPVRQRVQEIAAAIQSLTTIGAEFDKISFLIQFSPELSFFLQDRYDDAILGESHPITTALDQLLSSGSKSVQIWMNRAWFAPGVATKMRACYGSRLKFMRLNDEHKLIDLDDPMVYEKASVGRCSCTPLKVFGTIADGSEDLNTAIGLDLDLIEPILDLDTNDNEPFHNVDEDTVTKIEEDLNDEDDVDMEDALMPLDPGEADAIVENWEHTSSLLAHEDRMTQEIEFLVAMAPHMLSPSSGTAGMVAAAHLGGVLTAR
ncbi:uncharacterized protein N0V89_007981 [Didymosphaeria variabile]|uniref:Uncharacterized protein n=1 Tax=Didymosphaeria variabile TaxID=1932322 RepID=A0A9W8XGR9_9PLEO|nr:uncharacterized protein N0V89_007981 [Didymosphaeria variabile]KAJ4349367.1 hypothetical protein N0V89_007981 [Didymosphaeria variabile]